MLRIVATLALAALAACYDPDYRDGIECGTGGSCPSGSTCAADGTCRRGGGAQDTDAGVLADAGGGNPGDATGEPDAAAVDCDGDDDCQSPPTACLLAGTCDLGSNTCQFPAVNCSSLDGECTQGVCEPATGECVAQPANQDVSCGAGEVCGPFGACTPGADVCALTGTQSRSCTVNTCQAGACVASTEVESAACSLDTNGTMCGAPTVTDCGLCSFSTTCDELGSQTCTCTTFSCAGGTCTAVPVSCAQDCVRETDGDFCPPNGSCENGFCRQEPDPCPLCIEARDRQVTALPMSADGRVSSGTRKSPAWPSMYMMPSMSTSIAT